MKRILIPLLCFILLLIPTVPSRAVGIRVLGTFKLTAYSGSQVKHRKEPITASGKLAKAGHTIAVDPRVIKMGATVLIDGLGKRVAEDTGGAIKGKRIDVYTQTVHAAKRFGVQHRDVYLVGENEDR